MSTTIASTWSKGAEWLVGSIAVATPFAALVGVTGGELNRIVRNETPLFIISACFLVIAVICGVIATVRHNGVLVIAGLLAFAVALGGVVTAKAISTGRQERPIVAADLTDTAEGRVLTVTVRSAGLKTDEYVHVQVVGLNANRNLDGQTPTFDTSPRPRRLGHYFTQQIYRSRIGPNPDGVVDIKFAIEIAAGLYDQVQVVAQIFETGANRVEGYLEPKDLNRFACSCGSGLVGCITVLMPTPSTTATEAELAAQAALDECFLTAMLQAIEDDPTLQRTRRALQAREDLELRRCYHELGYNDLTLSPQQ